MTILIGRAQYIGRSLLGYDGAFENGKEQPATLFKSA
jgi:hypothetical protein